MLKDLRAIEATEIQIQAEGVYPGPRSKLKTKVAHVAKYQNDGTERIKASHFVERAAKGRRYWKTKIWKAISDILFKGGKINNQLEQVARMHIAYDIGYIYCDRIDTGRLRKSFVAVLKENPEASYPFYFFGPFGQ